jgi:PAS domain S-box-containing protein
MGWQETPYTIPLIAGAVVLALLALYLFVRRGPIPTVRTGAALLLAGALWMLGDALEMASTTLDAKLLWAIPSTLAICLIPPGWLIFVFQLTGRTEQLKRRNLLLLSVMPLLTLGLLLTNRGHGLYWRYIALDTSGPFVTLDKVHGPWFWVLMLYTYSLLLAACFLLLQAMRRSRRGYRWQAFVLLVAAFAAMLVNMLELSGFSPLPDLVTLPIYAVAGFLVAWSFLRVRHQDIVAISHEAIFASMGDAVIVTDRQHRVLDLNATAEQLVGRPLSEVVGRTLREVVTAWPQTMETLRESSSQEVELPGDAGARVYDVRTSVVKDWRGQLLSWVLVLRDINAHKAVESALRERSAELQSLTTELQARNQDLDAFARTVAHDLKGPLVGIIGYAETARRFSRALPLEQIEESLDAIIEGGRKLDRIIEELLLLASVRAEQVRVEPLAMARVVADVLQHLDFMIREREATVVLPEQWPLALGCEAWVREVWSNYISNAIKYGGRPPRVELGAEEGVNGRVRFWVRDNGAGLDAEEQGLLFKPFTQLARVRAEGYGLGLSIVRHIVEKLDGQVGVESELGKGSTFWFILPAVLPSCTGAYPPRPACRPPSR